jgi:hypothetical protein
MAEHWICIECEGLFSDEDGDLDKRMCNKCLDEIEECGHCKGKCIMDEKEKNDD